MPELGLSFVFFIYFFLRASYLLVAGSQDRCFFLYVCGWSSGLWKAVRGIDWFLSVCLSFFPVFLSLSSSLFFFLFAGFPSRFFFMYIILYISLLQCFLFFFLESILLSNFHSGRLSFCPFKFAARRDGTLTRTSSYIRWLFMRNSAHPPAPIVFFINK